MRELNVDEIDGSLIFLDKVTNIKSGETFKVKGAINGEVTFTFVGTGLDIIPSKKKLKSIRYVHSLAKGEKRESISGKGCLR